MPEKRHPSRRRYPPELRQRAVRTVHEITEAEGQRFGVVTRVARQLGVGEEWGAPGCARPRSTPGGAPA